MRTRSAADGFSLSVRHPAGFTMVELVVVIVLAGILAGLAIARFTDRTGFEAASFSDQAGAILRYAQKQAIAQNRAASAPVYVRFDGDSISLCLANSWPCPTTSQVLAPFSVTTDTTYCTSEHWYCLRRPSDATYTVSLGPVAAGAPHFLAFDGLGRPYAESGAAPLTAAMTLTVHAGTTTSTITVEPETGYVH